MQRNIKYIVLHCTDTPSHATVEAIKKYWKEKRGWDSPGYHYIVKANGEVVQLLSEKLVSNGVKGYNHESINIAYIGGKFKDGKEGDTRTVQQEDAMFDKIVELINRYPNAEIKGHRDFPNVAKTCPNFDAKTWLQNYVPGFLREDHTTEDEED